MNYWNIDLSELPSRGKEYPPESYIRIRPMTVGNCKYLSTLAQDNIRRTTSMLNEVLESCLKTNIQFNDLIWADRNYLLFWLRVNSFINSNGYDLDIDCPNCGEKISKHLKLDNLDIKYYEQCKFRQVSLRIGDADFVACANIPTVGEEKMSADDKLVEDILNYTNVREAIPDDTDPVWWVQQLDAMNFTMLKSIAEQGKFGIESVIHVHCDSCGQHIPVDVDLSDTNMFGRISLYEILKVQVQVSKYCGFQVSDDMSYTDVEIMQEAIKELIEEEKAEWEKQKSGISLTKPNFKMPSFHR